jgi:ribulose-5-phosphate 4-epimerase/fuculose-1-phosphate aldolase
MLYREEREKIISVLADMKTYGLIDPSGGALSMRCSQDHMVITTTTAAFERWHLNKEDFIVLDLNGNVVEMSRELGPSGTPIHMAIYSLFPRCRAVVHSHAPYSLAFACLGRSVPPTTNLLETLGEVPCLYADDASIKRQFRENPFPVEMPPGMACRPDVAAINVLHIIPQLREKMLPREEELSSHGLAFTIYRHGVVAFARNLDEACENLVRVETSARAYILGGFILARGASSGPTREPT